MISHFTADLHLKTIHALDKGRAVESVTHAEVVVLGAAHPFSGANLTREKMTPEIGHA